jgi:hypothetical protein
MRRRTVLGLVATALVAAIVIPSCLPLHDAVEDGPGVAGVYVLNGIDSTGEEYSGTVRITGGPDALTIQWIVTGGFQEGSGVLVGDRIDAEWHTISDPGGATSGTASYVVAEDGSMAGTRLVDGLDDVATEHLFLEP